MIISKSQETRIFYTPHWSRFVLVEHWPKLVISFEVYFAGNNTCPIAGAMKQPEGLGKIHHTHLRSAVVNHNKKPNKILCIFMGYIIWVSSCALQARCPPRQGSHLMDQYLPGSSCSAKRAVLLGTFISRQIFNHQQPQFLYVSVTLQSQERYRSHPYQSC